MIGKVVLSLLLVSCVTAASVEKLVKEMIGSKASIEESQKDLSCADCKVIAVTVGSAFISPEGLNLSTEYVRKPVCDALPAEYECEKHIGEFWPLVASWMFNPSEGWYAYKYFCKDVCPIPKKGEADLETPDDSENEVDTDNSSGPSCKACAARLYGNTAFMANKPVLEKAVSDFKKAKFCEIYAKEEEDKCNSALEIIIPTAMTALSKSGDKWIVGTCLRDIQCHE